MRKHDPEESIQFRSANRVFRSNDQWYFQTRELDHGPFSSEGEADRELKRYVLEMDFFTETADPSEAQDWKLLEVIDKEQRS
ncbi:MAG: DUF6316 family protein [Gammaproteobacteria bacterium]|nr:DUF6316 family protein [Gammaproteobacteria bacterium]